jgi:hypothetical protein
MSDRTEEEVAVAELSMAECWRAHQATDAGGDPAKPARRFAEWHADGCKGELNLARCRLSSLPLALREVAPRILRLDLSDNHLRSLPGALLAHCTVLKQLFCNRSQLLSLPAELGACATLQELHCGDNQLSSLPAELGACTALQFLECSYNQLSSLPEELRACTALGLLGCRNNKMESLPAYLGLLVNLQGLVCDNNPFIEGVPTTITALRAELGRHTKRAV